jgi:DnaK suppressor protein
MNSKTSTLDAAFIHTQHERLRKLRLELQRATQVKEDDETAVRSQSAGGAHESEDDAQKLAMLEVDGAEVARKLARLAQIERALQKIADGTYGSSDISGAAIPRARLEAVPEAIFTLAEGDAREAAANHNITRKT